MFWSFHFYGVECHSFAQTCHSCCPKQAFLKDLPSQKLLIVEVGVRMLTSIELQST